MNRVARIPSQEGTPPWLLLRKWPIRSEVLEAKRFELHFSVDADADGSLFHCSSWQNELYAGLRYDCLQGDPPQPVDAILERATLEEPKLQRTFENCIAEIRGATGVFILIVDATLTSQQGKLTENTFSVQNRKQRGSKKKRYGKRRYPGKKCHSFTFGLLITPSGIRIPYQIPFKTLEYCKQYGSDR